MKDKRYEVKYTANDGTSLSVPIMAPSHTIVLLLWEQLWPRANFEKVAYVELFLEEKRIAFVSLQRHEDHLAPARTDRPIC